MDPVHSWAHVAEEKPLSARRGFIGGLTVAGAATVTSALAGRAPADIAAVGVASLVPVVLLTVLIIRTNRRNAGHRSR